MDYAIFVNLRFPCFPSKIRIWSLIVSHTAPKSSDDFVRLSRQLVRHWRAERTQKQMDNLIHSTTPRWHKWETGYKNLKWPEFIQIASALTIPIDAILQKILSFSVDSTLDGQQVLNSLRTKFANMSVDEFARYMDMSSAKARRLLLEDQTVEFYQVLQFLGCNTQQLPFFLKSICPQWTPEEYSAWSATTLKQKKLEGSIGWLSALQALLTLDAYKKLPTHSDEWLAYALDVETTEVIDGLQLLESNASIQFKNGKYELCRGRVDMEDSIEESAQLARYWTQKCLERFDTADGVPSSRRGWAYRIFPISKVAQEKIRQEIFKFYGELHKIIAEDDDEKKEHVQIVLIHNFDLDEWKL